MVNHKINHKDLLNKDQDSMDYTYYFKYEDKVNDKSDYHACRMSLDLSLEENYVMDYVQRNVVEPPSNESATTNTKDKKCEAKLWRSLETPFKNIQFLMFLICAQLTRCMTNLLGCSNPTMKTETSFSKIGWRASRWIEGSLYNPTSWGLLKSRMTLHLLEKLSLTGNSLLLLL